MNYYPPTIQTLIECFKKLPGVGEKTAERFSLHTILMDDEILQMFSDALKSVKTKIKKCEKCNNFTEDDLCDICKDISRNRTTVCIVSDPKNIIAFEKTGKYNGLYFVLNGLISPLDGLSPDEINLNELIQRIQDDQIQEVILAVKPNIEGETTSLYISKILSGLDIKVTKIAQGVPMGAEMEYVDLLTLETALDNRIIIS